MKTNKEMLADILEIVGEDAAFTSESDHPVTRIGEALFLTVNSYKQGLRDKLKEYFEDKEQ